VRFLDRIDRSAIGALLDRDEYFWLDPDAPSNEEVGTLDHLFHFHPLPLEDLRKKGQRPKLEDFGDYMFLVYCGARDPQGGTAVGLEEVHAFIGGGDLVTVLRATSG
jgi:magnesium transporter